MSLIRDPLTLRVELQQWPHGVVQLLAKQDHREWVVHAACATTSFDRPATWLQKWGPMALAEVEHYGGVCAICYRKVPNVR